MKKVLLVAVIACVAMGCCKKASTEGDKAACCEAKKECCQKENCPKADSCTADPKACPMADSVNCPKAEAIAEEAAPVAE